MFDCFYSPVICSMSASLKEIFIYLQYIVNLLQGVGIKEYIGNYEKNKGIIYVKGLEVPKCDLFSLLEVDYSS